MEFFKIKISRRSAWIAIASLGLGIGMAGGIWLFWTPYFGKGVYCESVGGYLLPSAEHCDCLGYKVYIPPKVVSGTDIASDLNCVGIVISRWHRERSTIVQFDVQPPEATIDIEGTNLTGSLYTSDFDFDNSRGLKKVSEVAKQGKMSFQVSRAYKEVNGKLEFTDNTPLQVTVSYPGFKTWTSEVVLNKDPTNVQVTLDRMPSQ